MNARDLVAALREHADPDIASHSRLFFRAEPGGYGEGDRFLGIRVPVVRKVAREGRALPLPRVFGILRSRWHEERLLALVILADRFRRGDEPSREAVYDGYLDHTDYVNNWDLVDSSAYHIVGARLLARDRGPLLRLAASPSLWEQRIAVIATYAFIRAGQFDDTLMLAERLLDHEHDLIHKAVGWMLREVGNRDRETEERFLIEHSRDMPRTMLRYAIEKFPERRRKQYLRGEVG